VKAPLATVLGRISLFVLLASAIACTTARPVEQPASMTFRPTRSGEGLWLSTPIAVEVRNEREARLLESVDPMYVGEIGVRGGRVRADEVALVAAAIGATHFRVTGSDDSRWDVVLFRVEPDRWFSLPEELRPAPAAGPEMAEPRASL
jgi:hypothetical protein